MTEGFKRTKVFYKIRAAIHAKNEDGTRKWRYIILTGSSRSSKTTSIIQNFYSEAWNEENKRFSVWRDTQKNCKDTIGYDMDSKIFPVMPYYSPRTVQFNKTKSVYSFPAKSVIEINGTDDEERVHGYNGHVLWLNEPYSISKDTFDQLDQRTEDYVIIDMNPKGAHWADDLKKDSRAIVIHSTFNDNPYCPVEQRLKILSYQPVKLCAIVESKRLNEGDARIYDLSVNPLLFSEKELIELQRCRENERKNSANEYKWKVYGLGIKGEKPNRIFVWEEIEDHVYHAMPQKRYFGVDWGQVDPWGIIEVKYYDGALYVHELNYTSEEKLKQAMSFAEIQAVNGKEEGLVGWMFEKKNIPKNAYIICDDNRPMKVVALRTAGYDYAITAQKGPGSILDGIDLLSNLKVYYTRSSTNIAMEQENYSWKMYKGERTEEAEDANCHCVDPLRYVSQFMRTNEIIKKI